MVTYLCIRKCGRVVCNSCSPHRITIPYQYIVQPPGTPRLAPRYPGSSFLGGDARSPDFSALGGGERVRLCNPCVPDPNTAPPQQTQAQGSNHSRSHSNVAGGSGGSGSEAASPGYSNRWSSYFGPSTPSDGQSRHRSVTLVREILSDFHVFLLSFFSLRSTPNIYRLIATHRHDGAIQIQYLLRLHWLDGEPYHVRHPAGILPVRLLSPFSPVSWAIITTTIPFFIGYRWAARTIGWTILVIQP